MVLDSKKFDVNWPGPDNLYGYTGLEYDYYTDLNYARARYYKPEIGRFISEDTYKGQINNPQSLNLYTYVHNNPLIYIDPTRNWCESADGKHSFPGSCGNTKGTGSNDAESDGKWITFNGHKIEQYYYDTSNDSVSDLPWYEELLFGTVTGGVGGGASKVIKKGFDDVVTSAGKYFAKSTGNFVKVNNKTIINTAIAPKKGGETVAGHALQKHAGRNPDIWGKVKGGLDQINQTALKHLEDILNGPGGFKKVPNNKGIEFLEKKLPDGRGVRLNLDGTFKGFIDQ